MKLYKEHIGLLIGVIGTIIAVIFMLTHKAPSTAPTVDGVVPTLVHIGKPEPKEQPGSVRFQQPDPNMLAAWRASQPKKKQVPKPKPRAFGAPRPIKLLQIPGIPNHDIKY